MARRLGFKPVSRVYGPDLMRRLTEVSALKGYRQFYYGGGPGLADQLAATLKARHPALPVAGTMTPPSDRLRRRKTTPWWRISMRLHPTLYGWD